MHDACKWTVPNHRVLACRHEIYIRVGALLCFLACKLAGTCYLFVQQKRSREKARGGARLSRYACERVRSVRGPGASALRGADGGGVGARAVAGYRAERASKRDK